MQGALVLARPDHVHPRLLRFVPTFVLIHPALRHVGHPPVFRRTPLTSQLYARSPPSHLRQGLRGWVCRMCGGCAKEPMVSFHPDDVVRYTSATGAPPRVGRVEDLDPIWGVSVQWESGERSWFAYESWCPLREETGWSLVLTTAQFMPAADFAVAPEEFGRGWLAKPLIRTIVQGKNSQARSRKGEGLRASIVRKRRPRRDDMDAALLCVEIACAETEPQ